MGQKGSTFEPESRFTKPTWTWPIERPGLPQKKRGDFPERIGTLFPIKKKIPEHHALEVFLRSPLSLRRISTLGAPTQSLVSGEQPSFPGSFPLFLLNKKSWASGWCQDWQLPAGGAGLSFHPLCHFPPSFIITLTPTTRLREPLPGKVLSFWKSPNVSRCGAQGEGKAIISWNVQPPK